MDVVTKKLCANGCGHKKVGCEYHGENSQMKLLGNSLLHKMDGRNLLMGKFFKTMVATPIVYGILVIP